MEPATQQMHEQALPDIDGRESFDALIWKLSSYFVHAIEVPHTFEDLRTVSYGRCLTPLVQYLRERVHHPQLVCALLALKGHFSVLESEDDRGISHTRGLACELVAWRFVSHLTDPDSIDYLLCELPLVSKHNGGVRRSNSVASQAGEESDATLPNEHSPLLHERPRDGPPAIHANGNGHASKSPVRGDGSSFANNLEGLNALEIAAVSDAKKFLSQKAIQRIINGIWKGDIVFWETLSTHSEKKAMIYSKKRSDPFCRLRVPLYAKVFEVLFFAAFLAFYYTVLIARSFNGVTVPEVMLYVWIVAFGYNEFGEFWDAGGLFYSTDFWSLWDLGIIVVGVAFFVVRIVGLAKHDHATIDTAFDILSIEALFLVPRICSLLSLNPYFGTLIPCLKEMTKDFIKFIGLIAILYVGFLTTFCLLARDHFTFSKMSWILIKVFFGSSYLGFDVAEEISPILGPPLMFIFVCLTNILLITSLISLLSNSLTKVMEHAKDEYLFVYAVYVLEASTSNRLTYFIPPLNLIPLLLRPLRLAVPAETLRSARIILLKVTHLPFVALILGYEGGRQYLTGQNKAKSSFAASSGSVQPLRRLFSGKTLQKSLAAATGTGETFPLDKHARVARSTAAQRPRKVAPETIDVLESMANTLKVQLEELSAAIAREKAQLPPSSSD